MSKKFLLGVLIAISTFGVFSISEAHRGNDYDCRDGYCHRNYCCGNFYNDDDDCGGYCRERY